MSQKEGEGIVIVMSMEEQFKLQTIAEVVAGKIKRVKACQILQVSENTLRRYIRAFEKKGALFVKHGNYGSKPWNKLHESLKKDVKRLVREKYFDFNVIHLREKLRDEEDILVSYETLRKWCHELHMMKRSHTRRRKPKHYRDRMPQRGLMLQMDGSTHKWFGSYKSCLIAAIDDATNEVPYAEFFTSEDTLHCMKVLERIVRKFGIFQILYVDRAGLYQSSKRAEFGQLVRACEELGIRVLYAHSPEAKGRVERLFQTLQDRLIAEMRLRNINTFEEANKFLQKEFLPNHYTPKFTVNPEEEKSAYEKLSNQIDPHQVFCIKHYRQIQKDHTISWQGEYYAFQAPDGISVAGHKMEIREYLGGIKQAYYRNRPLKLIPTHRPSKIYRKYYNARRPSKSLGTKPYKVPW